MGGEDTTNEQAIQDAFVGRMLHYFQHPHVFIRSAGLSELQDNTQQKVLSAKDQFGIAELVAGELHADYLISFFFTERLPTDAGARRYSCKYSVQDMNRAQVLDT